MIAVTLDRGAGIGPIDETSEDATAPVAEVAAPFDWVGELTATGARQEAAIRRLHDLMRRAAARYLRTIDGAENLGQVRRAEIIEATADTATVEVLNKLPTFEGRSRFTTWAYKFAILTVAVEARRAAWRPREVDLAAIDEPLAESATPHEQAELAAVTAALRTSIETSLTAHQRRVLVAIVIDAVPIAILADRLGTNRNALYKTLHDARKRVRQDLIAQGLVEAPTRRGGKP